MDSAHLGHLVALGDSWRSEGSSHLIALLGSDSQLAQLLFRSCVSDVMEHKVEKRIEELMVTHLYGYRVAFGDVLLLTHIEQIKADILAELFKLEGTRGKHQHTHNQTLFK